jgi:hypothetical protein
MFFFTTVNTGVPCLNVKPALRTIPFIRFKIGIRIVFPIGPGDQNGHTNE